MITRWSDRSWHTRSACGHRPCWSSVRQRHMGTTTGRRHHIVIVGCGFGGLFAAKTLGRADVDVTVIDRTNHHLFQPLLYQMATGILSEGDIAPPIRDVLRNQRNATVVLGNVQGIDVDRRSLTIETLGQSSEVAYDSLILATGADQSY